MELLYLGKLLYHESAVPQASGCCAAVKLLYHEAAVPRETVVPCRLCVYPRELLYHVADVQYPRQLLYTVADILKGNSFTT
jgi:hypothetical protein